MTITYKFEMDLAHCTSITIRKQWSMYDGKTNLTHEQLVKILKGEDRCSSIHSEDHPEFAKMRDFLEKYGFITTSRNSWNGDYVKREFIFCGSKFNVGEKFPSGAAIKGHLKYMKRSRRKGL